MGRVLEEEYPGAQQGHQIHERKCEYCLVGPEESEVDIGDIAMNARGKKCRRLFPFSVDHTAIHSSSELLPCPTWQEGGPGFGPRNKASRTKLRCTPGPTRRPPLKSAQFAPVSFTPGADMLSLMLPSFQKPRLQIHRTTPKTPNFVEILSS